jgi:hypothetical protein
MWDYPLVMTDPNTIPNLLAKKLGPKWTVYDGTEAGDTMETVVKDQQYITNQYNPGNLRNELILWAGGNDGRWSDTWEVASSEVQSYLLYTLSVGWRVSYIALLPSAQNLGYWVPDEYTFRTGLNLSMRSWCASHNVRWLDPAQDSRLADPYNAFYYDGPLHLTNEGKKLVAAQIYNMLKTP